MYKAALASGKHMLLSCLAPFGANIIRVHWVKKYYGQIFKPALQKVGIQSNSALMVTLQIPQNQWVFHEQKPHLQCSREMLELAF